MSKRKLLQLVEQNIVSGWDDPRMPTVSGLRRRGYTPASIRNFIERVGVAKRDNVIDVSLLEFSVREDLNKVAQRAMAVLNPVKLVITNYPKDKTEEVLFEINPEDPNAGTRKIPFSRELYIEREDFKEEATGSFFRLSLGSEVRLKGAYIIKATGLEKDASGAIIQINCTYDPASLSGSGTPASLRKVKGTLHWVSASHANKAEIRVYDRLFLEEAPDGHKDKDFMEFLNPNSLLISEGFIEPFLSKATPGDTFQFQRLGYFRVDEDSTSQQIVFNKTVGLRDTWTKKKPKQNPSTSSSQNTTNTHQRPAIEEIKKLGKKYTNLPEEKQLKTRAEIIKLAEKVAYDDLSPLFNTTAKKVGTRIAVALTLGVMLKNGQEKTAEAQEFIEKALADSNQILAQEAKNLV